MSAAWRTSPTEFDHGRPAPFGGAYIKLTRAVTTQPRKKQATLDFYDRNHSGHSGEFTDAQRHYFVLEPPRPPLPPLPPPDMDAIRAAMEASERAANASRDLFY